ncbi:ankyrin repeat domain-containing protein [Novispirillum sp. DQ9]|uniref:ankyrin repeat domain-containing protein n=1 Tax=Novispirillum sp. DQ9 TaxID=3398612 RepID=UPI003C7C40A8
MNKPPYPMIGEACQIVTGAFGTKSADPSHRKELDRLAREGDFDWSLRPKLVEALLVNPLRKFDRDYGSFVGKFVNFVLDRHVEMVMRLSMDALSREEAAPLLVETAYGAHIAAFLISLKDQFGGPDLGDFLRDDANPIDVVFRWAEVSLGLEVAALAFPDEKQKRDEVGRWRRGDTIPDFFGSLRPVQRELQAKRPDRKSGVALFGKWLVTARALVWLGREAKEAGYGSLLGLVRKEILLNCPPRDIGIILSHANIEAGNRFSELKECGLPLLNFKLARTRPKMPGDQATARRELDRFTTLTDNLDPDGRTRYFLDWCEGRWHVLAGHEDKAIDYYERAANQALYRAGENQKQILEEGISLAARLRKKPIIKRLKHRALAIGLFAELFSEAQENSLVVSDWEVEQLDQAFGMLFPARSRFHEAEARPNVGIGLPFRAFDQAAADRLKPDLTAPDRVISIPTFDGHKYRRPQLIWFASVDRVEDVRRLLEAGADVNKPCEQGGSALLNALQCAEDGRGRQVLDLLLACPHERGTLDRLTVKKRLSPLYLSVLLGDPVVVSRLLEMEASADQPAGFPPQTPLYVCVERFAVYRPGWMKGHLLHRMAFPSANDREIHRRYSGGWAGAMGDRVSGWQMAGSEGAGIMGLVADALVQKAARVPREHYLQIAEHLLKHGADPNRRHSRPGPGRTPLMLAAESDAADAFRLLLDAGGEPYLKDDQGNDCLAIATGFGSQDVLAILKG